MTNTGFKMSLNALPNGLIEMLVVAGLDESTEIIPCSAKVGLFTITMEFILNIEMYGSFSLNFEHLEFV